MKKLFILGSLLFFSGQAYSADVSLSDETIILAQMLTDNEVQKCIRKIEDEYNGRFNIWLIVRRQFDPTVSYEEGSAALAAHSKYFLRGRVGENYKGPDAVVVERTQDPALPKYACEIIDKMPHNP